jgi:double-stranded uracil-DNA glycosylase
MIKGTSIGRSVGLALSGDIGLRSNGQVRRNPTFDVTSSSLISKVHPHSKGLRDIISTELNVVFCGINPGMRSATLGLHFANRNNRFWRVLHLAGFTPRQLEPKEARLLLDYGYGITSAVERPTVSATELSRGDYLAARPGFERKIARYRPRFVAFLGKAACSVFLNQRGLPWGFQQTGIEGSRVWVLPNPSGLNCAFTIGVLTDVYRELFEAVTL